jgi:hypothetical protein
MCHACDGVAFDASYPTALVGFQMCALRRFDPVGRASRVSSTGSDPPAVHQSIGRSVLAARSAGPLEAWERCVSSPSAVSMPCKHGGLLGKGATRVERALEGSVDRGSVGSASGFPHAPVCGRPVPAFVFSGACTSCLGLSPLSGLTDAAPRFHRGLHVRAEANAPPRSIVRPAAALPRPYPLMGFASVVSASRRVR